MDYPFSRDYVFDRIIFALHLDREKHTERIIIGTELEVKLRMSNPRYGDVYFDSTRRLGEFLVHFPQDPDGQWNMHLTQLRESYDLLKQPRRWRIAEPHRQFLVEQYNSDDPVLLFMAVRVWQYYLSAFDKNHGPDFYDHHRSVLTRTLRSFDNEPLWQRSLKTLAFGNIDDKDERLELKYPSRRRGTEYAVATFSFLPLIYYYMTRLQDWGLLFQKCQICGERFLASSRHFKLCSEECRKEQNRRTKRKFDEEAKSMGEEAQYKYFDGIWYNKLRSLKNKKDTDPDFLAELEKLRKQYQAQSKDKKHKVKRSQLTLQEYNNWLVEQERELNQRIQQEKDKRAG